MVSRSTSTRSFSRSATRWSWRWWVTPGRHFPLSSPFSSREDRSWQEGIEADVVRWWELIENKATQDGEPLTPQRPLLGAESAAPRRIDHHRGLGDSSELVRQAHQDAARDDGVTLGNLASMGPGVPYAIAAKFAHPDRPAIAFVGDGAMQMLGLNELITARHYYDGPTRD